MSGCDLIVFSPDYFDFDRDFRIPLRVFGCGGTFVPARRASEMPMAIACLRLVTFLPDMPERSLPSLNSCKTRETFLLALTLYLDFLERFVDILALNFMGVGNERPGQAPQCQVGFAQASGP